MGSQVSPWPIEKTAILLSLEEVAMDTGHDELMEVGNILLIVSNSQWILDQWSIL
jgi:hypothetical protein